MAANMEWSHDFCLSCDRQISDGAYCSQQCRLADLERNGSSEPSSPLSSPSLSSSWGSTGIGSASGFYLPPAVNFSAYKPNNTRSPPQSPLSRSPHSTNPYFSHRPSSPASCSSRTSPTRKVLTPSSSMTSLTSTFSTLSTQNKGIMSEQVQTELRNYDFCFSQARDSRRRPTRS